MKRREAMLGAAAGLLGRLSFAAPAPGAPEAVPVSTLPGKGALIRHAFRPPNYETPLADLRPVFTANEAFFVRYHLAVIPRIDPRTWRLEVSGASAQHSLSLSLHDLASQFEQVTIAAVNQCSGNRRGLFTPRVPGVQWANGAMGNAKWKGVRLREILRRAGIAPQALEVWFSGADSAVLPSTPAFMKSLPVERALDESTLIALQMNGAPLPHWNGAPARLVVPGWTGTYWMKHLTAVRIEPKALDNFWMKSAYRLPSGAFPGPAFASQATPETTPITEILVNSLITSHASGARLRRGERAEVAGKAWDNGSGIERVEYSTDAGENWSATRLGRDLGRFAWREFSLALDTSRPGALEVLVRARSRNGTQQPAQLTFNPAGYHDNIIQKVSLEIS